LRGSRGRDSACCSPVLQETHTGNARYLDGHRASCNAETAGWVKACGSSEAKPGHSDSTEFVFSKHPPKASCYTVPEPLGAVCALLFSPKHYKNAITAIIRTRSHGTEIKSSIFNDVCDLKALRRPGNTDT